MTRIEVFADITCPFTHVGLKRVIDELEDLDIDVVVRAWPLEWVNDSPLEADAVDMKVKTLREQLDTDAFAGFRPDVWPTSTIPALNLAAEAYAIDDSTGLAVSIAVRDALFEEGRDIADPVVLHEIGAQYGVTVPAETVDDRVRADYEEGQRRGVRGSPDYWLGDEEFFCPSLQLGHGVDGLTTAFDTKEFDQFMVRVRSLAS